MNAFNTIPHFLLFSNYYLLYKTVKICPECVLLNISEFWLWIHATIFPNSFHVDIKSGSCFFFDQ